MNDGRVVTFTQAGVTSCPVKGEKGKNGNPLYCPFIMKLHILKKTQCIQPPPPHFSPLSTWQLASGSFWAVETSLWTFGDVTVREEVQRVVLCVLLYACLHFHPAWLAFKASFWTPPDENQLLSSWLGNSSGRHFIIHLQRHTRLSPLLISSLLYSLSLHLSLPEAQAVDKQQQLSLNLKINCIMRHQRGRCESPEKMFPTP